jgi:hypothetical protein
VVVVVVVFRAVVVVVGAVVAVVTLVDAVATVSAAAAVSVAAVPLDAEPAAMAPVSTSAASALDAAVTWRARRAGWGRRRRMGVFGVVSMPR